MRILVLLIFTCTPFLSGAQHWNFSVQGGGILNSKSSKPAQFEQASPGGGTFAAGVGCHWNNHWETGLRLGYRQYAFMQEDNLLFESEIDPLTGTVKRISRLHRKFKEPIPAFSVAPYISRHFGQRRMDYFLGFSPAYLRFFEKEPERAIGFVRRLTTDKNGFGIDVNAGIACRLSTAFSVYAECAGGMVNIPSFRERATIYTASLSLGMRLSFK